MASQEGAQRRIRALHARGWAPEAMERAAGLPQAVTEKVLDRRERITPDMARQCADAYERLWNQVPPQVTSHDRALADVALARAHGRGWAPPMAWDDDVIDLPEGRPAGGWKRSPGIHRRSADLAEDVAFVREHGGYSEASRTAVAIRLGVSVAAIDKALQRAAGREADQDREAG